MYQSKVLIVSEKVEVSKQLKHFFERKGFKAFTANDYMTILGEIEAEKFDLLIADIRVNEKRPSDFLEKLKKNVPELPILLLSYFNEVKTAANWVSRGVFTYALHPIEPEEIWLYANEALGEDKIVRPIRQRLTSSVAFFTAEDNPLEAAKQYRFVSSSPSQNVKKLTQLLAPLHFNIFLIGADGAGKSRLAKTIHAHSKKVKDPFIQVQCSLLNNEEQWSIFTAVMLERKRGATVFFNQVSSLSNLNQKRLYRFLTENNVPNEIGELPFRIIVAEYTSLSDTVQTGKFYEDLYHLLNQAYIELPPLFLDTKGIQFYTDVFVNEANDKFNKQVEGVSVLARNLLKQYSWPGNLRQLRGVIYRAVLNCSTKKLEPQSLQQEISSFSIETHLSAELATLNLKEAAEKAEAEVILQVLKQTRQNKSKTATILGVDRKTLYNKMAAYGLLDKS